MFILTKASTESFGGFYTTTQRAEEAAEHARQSEQRRDAAARATSLIVVVVPAALMIAFVAFVGLVVNSTDVRSGSDAAITLRADALDA